MAWVTDEKLERRARRTLSKYGYKLHKSRKKGGGYTITGGYYPDEPDSWYPDLDELNNAVGEMVERFEEIEARSN